jgi:hypothetical protein
MDPRNRRSELQNILNFIQIGFNVYCVHQTVLIMSNETLGPPGCPGGRRDSVGSDIGKSCTSYV